MRRLLPSRIELAIFAALAIILAMVVAQFQPGSHDIGAAALVAPVFVVAAIMGLRRSPQWAEPTDAESESIDEG
jgi:hypothetical protein